MSDLPTKTTRKLQEDQKPKSEKKKINEKTFSLKDLTKHTAINGFSKNELPQENQQKSHQSPKQTNKAMDHKKSTKQELTQSLNTLSKKTDMGQSTPTPTNKNPNTSTNPRTSPKQRTRSIITKSQSKNSTTKSRSKSKHRSTSTSQSKTQSKYKSKKESSHSRSHSRSHSHSKARTHPYSSSYPYSSTKKKFPTHPPKREYPYRETPMKYSKYASQKRAVPKKGNRIYIKNLPLDINELELREYFNFGEILYVKLLEPQSFMTSSAALIAYKKVEDAETAIHETNHKLFFTGTHNNLSVRTDFALTQDRFVASYEEPSSEPLHTASSSIYNSPLNRYSTTHQAKEYRRTNYHYNRLFVYNLENDVTRKELFDFFRPFGKMSEIEISRVKSKHPQEREAYAHIKFENPENGFIAMRKLNNTKINQRDKEPIKIVESYKNELDLITSYGATTSTTRTTHGGSIAGVSTNSSNIRKNYQIEDNLIKKYPLNSDYKQLDLYYQDKYELEENKRKYSKEYPSFSEFDKAPSKPLSTLSSSRDKLPRYDKSGSDLRYRQQEKLLAREKYDSLDTNKSSPIPNSKHHQYHRHDHQKSKSELSSSNLLKSEQPTSSILSQKVIGSSLSPSTERKRKINYTKGNEMEKKNFKDYELKRSRSNLKRNPEEKILKKKDVYYDLEKIPRPSYPLRKNQNLSPDRKSTGNSSSNRDRIELTENLMSYLNSKKQKKDQKFYSDYQYAEKEMKDPYSIQKSPSKKEKFYKDNLRLKNENDNDPERTPSHNHEKIRNFDPKHDHNFEIGMETSLEEKEKYKYHMKRERKINMEKNREVGRERGKEGGREMETVTRREIERKRELNTEGGRERERERERERGRGREMERGRGRERELGIEHKINMEGGSERRIERKREDIDNEMDHNIDIGSKVGLGRRNTIDFEQRHTLFLEREQEMNIERGKYNRAIKHNMDIEKTTGNRIERRRSLDDNFTSNTNLLNLRERDADIDRQNQQKEVKNKNRSQRDTSEYILQSKTPIAKEEYLSKETSNKNNGNDLDDKGDNKYPTTKQIDQNESSSQSITRLKNLNNQLFLDDKTLLVFGLSKTVNEKDVFQIFSQFGPVIAAQIIAEGATEIVIITFFHSQSARKAKLELNNTKIGDSVIFVLYPFINLL
ncbi:chascon isoform d-related [Anaeramoeba flamelloides]|uniref:Chascon isoform d-related n=1 Tax=Anaeramoeba flamelloides TaxID=1746091 RepID=A0AAV8AA88_9EUKA|nr:chascon isoform d-related [Anaeramoeba flamelloides]